jgi:hypothetical protein
MPSEIRPLFTSGLSGSYYARYIMTKDDKILLGNIGSIYHEIRQSFYYMFSVCSSLKEKAPSSIEDLLGEVVKICDDLRTEIDNPPSIFSFHSAEDASDQLRTYVNRWEKELGTLEGLVNEIINSKIQLEDDAMNKLLNESLYRSFQRFSKIVDTLVVIQAEDLTVDRF